MLRLLSRLLISASGWRDIATVPCDCAVQLAAFSGAKTQFDFPCLRRGNDWFDAETMRPVAVSATHWRYWQPDVLPMSCC